MRRITRGAGKVWTKFTSLRWHQQARLIALLLLADQGLGSLSGIPQSEAIVVVCLGALFAPVPVEKEK